MKGLIYIIIASLPIFAIPRGQTESPALGWPQAGGDTTSWAVTAEWERLHLSFGGGMMEGRFGLFHERPGWGLGLYAEHFNSQGYYRTDIALPVKIRPFGRALELAMRPGLARDGFKAIGETDDPLLENIEIAPFLDAGLILKWGILDIGLSAKGLVPVKLGGETAVSESPEYGGSLGISPLWLGGRISTSIGYKVDNPQEEALDYGATIQKSIGDNLNLALSLSRLEIGGRLSLLVPGFDNLLLSAGYDYPTGDISVGNGSIEAGLSYVHHPPIARPDIEVFCALDAGPHRITDTLLATFTVANTGDQSTGDFRLAIGKLDTFYLNLRRGSDRTIEILIPAGSPGTKSLSIEADIDNAVVEYNESNNSASCSYTVAPLPATSISVDRSTLSLRSIKYTYQDEALVPMVFFKRDDFAVDRRFDRVLGIFAERFKENPMVRLHLLGFLADDEQSDVLAVKRAMAVRDRLLELAPELVDRIVIESLSDSLREAMTGTVRNTKDGMRVQDEKRRVLLEVSMPDISIKLPVEGEISHFLESHEIGRILRENPDLSVVVWGDDEAMSMEKAIERAGDMAGRIQDRIGNEDRIFPTYARMEGKSDMVKVFLSAEGVLYRPRVVHASSDYTPGQNSDCDIMLGYEGAEIDSWKVELSQGERAYWTVEQGKETPPERIVWDFRDQQGNIMPIDREFNMRMVAEDILGQTAVSEADANISTIVELNQKRTEMLLVVQFQFNRPEAASRYLDDRLASIARRIISTVSDFDSTHILIEGHSDDIGSQRRNLELSQERADAVYDRIIRVMDVLLSGEKPDVFLDRNKARMEARGFGTDRPYKVTEWIEGKPVERLSGNNALPEGRTINRRVMVSIVGWK